MESVSRVFLIAFVLIWGVLHSVLASHPVKDAFRRVAGSGAARFYRLAYNGFAVVSFLPILAWMRLLPDRMVYLVAVPWRYGMLAGQALAALLLFIALLQTDLFAFLGLSQWTKPGVEENSLIRHGLYRFVRHPLYLFGLIFLWLTPFMTLNMLVVYAALTLYIFIGAYFEERKLLRQFGAAYAEYRSHTPMIIPGLRFGRGAPKPPPSDGYNH